MTKADLITSVQQKLEIEVPKKDIDAILKAYVDVVNGVLTNDPTEKVPLPGVGAFTVKDVAAKSGVTKLGGVEKEWSTPAHKELKFTIAKSVKTI